MRGGGNTKFPWCKGPLEPGGEAGGGGGQRRPFLLAGTKKGEDAQCSRVAAHGRLRRRWQLVTNELLIRTGEGCSCPALPPRSGLAVIFCLARLAAGSG